MNEHFCTSFKSWAIFFKSMISNTIFKLRLIYFNLSFRYFFTLVSPSYNRAINLRIGRETRKRTIAENIQII